MNLQDHILDVQQGIKAGRFSNEASVSQGIVLRLLQALDWPTYDTQIVSPEYTVSGKRVDFALCYPHNKPIVFIEVKQVGQSEGAERQLFEYAFHVGVPMAILTDGQEWHFFLPAEQGHYQERRVYKLDLLERNIDEVVEYLQRYLTYSDICSGGAIENARRDYKNVSRERQIQITLPTAWSKIIEEQDEILIELVSDKVESLCGYRPDISTVSSYLAGISGIDAPMNRLRVSTNQNKPGRTSNTGKDVKTITTKTSAKTKSFGFELFGQYHQAKSGYALLINLFEELSKLDPTFPERFAALPKHGRTRRYLAKTPRELFPERPDLVKKNFHQLTSGWWIGGNLSTQSIGTIIKMACDVAGLSYGDEIKVLLGN
ncbi:MAG: type I restriction enzyme HsdR N-terminal domain-containing protein [Chloroflexota bacterium]